ISFKILSKLLPENDARIVEVCKLLQGSLNMVFKAQGYMQPTKESGFEKINDTDQQLIEDLLKVLKVLSNCNMEIKLIDMVESFIILGKASLINKQYKEAIAKFSKALDYQNQRTEKDIFTKA